MTSTESESKALEDKWTRRWKESKVFESNPNLKPKYFLTVPYPYASGALHVGHARSYTLGDVTARYQRMLGKNVLFPMASHITGTPILAISRKIEQKDKKAVEGNREYVSYYIKDKEKVDETVAGFSNPVNVASFYANAIRQDFESMGYSIDWRRFFTTGDPAYNAFIRWQYKHLNDKGYIVKGKHAVYYCPNCSNPVTTDDIKSGDEYSIEMSEFYLLKEHFEDGYLVAATLRPETIFGVVNVWINSNEDYVKAKVDNEVWYVSEKFVQKFKDQQHQVEVIQKFKGKDLAGKKVGIPLAERSVSLLAAEFVDANIATGVVNSVPAHAPYDYIAGEELMKKEKIDLTPIALITVDGYSKIPAKDLIEKEHIVSQSDYEKLEKVTAQLYKDEYYRGITNENCGEFAHLRVTEAKEKVIEKLKSERLLSTTYENGIKDSDGMPVKEPKCRCGSPISIKVLSDQWFLDYSNAGWKELAREALLKMDIQPELYRKGFEHTIEWLHEWPCTRNRGLGTRFPLDDKWMIESLSDSTIYMAYYTIAHLINENKLAPENLTPELFDYIFLNIGDVKNASEKTKIKPELLEKIKEEFNYWYPMDERRTGTAHISNHLTFMIFHHTAVFPSQHWPKKISLNEMLIAEGRKMSKSLGNVIPIHNSVLKNSADVVRLYLVYAADPSSTLDWRDSQVDSTKKRVKQFQDIITNISSLKEEIQEQSTVDSWLNTRLQKAIKETRNALDAGDCRKALQHALYELVNDYNWYARRASKPNSKTLKPLAKAWVRLMTPFIPFTCEELWEKLAEKEFASNALYPQVDESQIDEKTEAQEQYIANLMEDLKKIIEVMKTKPNKIHLYLTPEWKIKAINLLKQGKPIKEAMEDPEIRSQGKEAAKIMQMRKDELPKTLYTTQEEKTILQEAKTFLEKEFNSQINIQEKPTHDPQNKAKYALPGKPGIYLE
jgi:leucyl-tRNA synthetase